MRQAIDLQGFAGFSDGVTQYLSSLGKKKKGRRKELLNRVRNCVTASRAESVWQANTGGGLLRGRGVHVLNAVGNEMGEGSFRDCGLGE
jgi:hypothetical protein